jgi:Na+-driven multidrug efflux pump
MQTLMIGAGLNLLLDTIFIFYLDGGVRGAAVATVLSQTVSALWVLTHLLGSRGGLRLRWENLRLQPALVGQIAAAGSPPWTMTLAGSGVQALLNNLLQLHGGDLAISVIGIIYGITAMIRMPIAGLSQGAQPIIGYNRGAHEHGRVRRTLKITLAVATTFSFSWFVAVEFCPEQILRLFGAGAPGLAEMGCTALRIFLSALPLVGFQMVSASYFQAVGKPRVAMLLAFSRQVLLLIPLLLILPRFFGLNGIWLAVPAADLISALLSGYYLGKELRELDMDKGPPGGYLLEWPFKKRHRQG